jgi:hypothetical protein
MNPIYLIGMPYRLGADPEKHRAADCVSLSRTVLKHYGIKSQQATRNWYRRLKKKDYSIFKEQLEIWGIRAKSPKIGTVGLCVATEGYGLAVYFEEGWLNISEGSEVRWTPLGVLAVQELYSPKKSNYVTS